MEWAMEERRCLSAVTPWPVTKNEVGIFPSLLDNVDAHALTSAGSPSRSPTGTLVNLPGSFLGCTLVR